MSALVALLRSRCCLRYPEIGPTLQMSMSTARNHIWHHPPVSE